MLLERGEVVRLVAAGEDAGVDARVQRLHAAAEHLRRGRHVLDALDRQADLLESGRRVPARDELAAEADEPARELVHAGLVLGGDQRAHSSLTTSGSRRCSTAWMRSRERVRGVVRQDGHALGRDNRAGVDALVDVVDGGRRLVDAGREHVLDRVRAGEARAAATGAMLTIRAAEVVEERLRKRCM